MPIAHNALIHLHRMLWKSRASMDNCLSQLVIALGARAAGCWRLEQKSLHLVGFGWADDMPLVVSKGFQKATRHVSLLQGDLGIVKAAVSQKPAIGRLDAGATGLVGSATWIERFGARTSLAVPILTSVMPDVVGVIAVSTAAEIRENDACWQALIRLSSELEYNCSHAGV